MSHVLLLGQMLCSGFSLHLRWPLLLLSFYKHLDTWDSFLSSFAVQPSISVFKLYLSHTSIQKKKKKRLTQWQFHSSVPLLNWQPRSELPVNWNTPSIPYPVTQNHLLGNALLPNPILGHCLFYPTCAESADTWVTGTGNGAERTLTTLLPKFHSVNPCRCRIYNTDATPKVSIHLTHHSVTEWPLVQTSLHLSTHPAISVTFHPPSSSPVSEIWQLVSVSSGCWSRTGPGQPRGRRQRQHQQRQSGRVHSSSPLRQTPPVPSGN